MKISNKTIFALLGISIAVIIGFYAVGIINESNSRPSYTKSTAKSFISACKKYAFQNLYAGKKVKFCYISNKTSSLDNYAYYWSENNFIFILNYEGDLYLYDSKNDQTVLLAQNN